MALMAFGMFVFETSSLPIDQLQRSREWQHQATPRMGARPVRQFTGPGEETLDITGGIIPELAGKYSSLAQLATMADSGDAYQLIRGDGQIFGSFVITHLEENHQTLMDDGRPRRVNFRITLARVPDDWQASSAKINSGSVA